MHFSRMFRNTLEKILLIPLHAVARGNHKSIIKEGFHGYFNRVHKINSSNNGIFHKWLQGLLFSLYDCNSVLVDRTAIS